MTLLACLLLPVSAPQAREQNRKPTHSRGYLLAVKLNRALARTPMRGTGWALVSEGKRVDLHPGFIAAVAGFESSYGARMCEPFNAWGLGSCRRAWTPPPFASWRDSIRFFAGWFRSRWRPSTDMWTVGRSYCPPCASGWGNAVALRMRLLGFEPSTRFPR